MLAAALNFLLREYRTRRMARFAAGVIVFALALALIDYLKGGVPGLLWIVLAAALAVVCVYGLVRLVGAFKKQILWHLRRRLIVTYIFIALVPIVLILVLVGLAAVMVNGQFAAFLVATRLHDQVEELRQVNRVVAHEAHLSQAKTPDELLDDLRRFYVQELVTHSDSYPGLEVALLLDSEKRAFYLNGTPIPETLIIPEWLHDREEFSGIVADRGRISLRAFDQGETPVGPIKMVLSEPLSPELLDIVGVGIGPIGIVVHPEDQGIPISPVPRNIQKSVFGHTFEDSVALLSSTVTLPPPANFLDANVFGTSTLAPVRWGGSSEEHLEQPVFVLVTSRLSILSGWLLATLGRYSRAYVMLFLAVAVIFLAIELISLVVGIKLTRTVTQTVDKLYEATERVKAGDFSHRINMPAHDQLSSLGQAFDGMTSSIEHLVSESQEKSRLEQEIQFAHQVQQQLFPRRVPEVPGLQLYGICRPARGVSGDYYDFLPMTGDRLGIVLGDVSGKGISAALIMASVQSIIRTRLYEGSFPNGQPDSTLFSTAHFFWQLNQQVCESTPEEKYATCFYALYDATARRLVYTNAGHPPPVLLRQNAITRLDVGGTPLGLISPTAYEEADVILEPGDLLVAFTDGFTESENAFGEQFGDERLIDVVRRCRNATLQEMVQSIYQSVDEWTEGKEPDDDRTLIVARALQ